MLIAVESVGEFELAEKRDRDSSSPGCSHDWSRSRVGLTVKSDPETHLLGAVKYAASPLVGPLLRKRQGGHTRVPSRQRMRMERYLFSTFDVSRQGELQVGSNGDLDRISQVHTDIEKLLTYLKSSSSRACQLGS